MARLTDKGITGLKSKPERYEVWEGDGFGVRVTPRGTKSFVLLYHFEGKPRRMTLGRYPAMTLAQARTAAAAAREKLDHGIDPGAEKVAATREERAAETVSDLIDDYLRLHADPKKKSAGEDRRILDKDVRPRWGSRKAFKIKRADVVSLLDEIAGRGAPIMANRTLAVVRRMFNFAIRRGVVEANPCAQVERPGEEKRRERRLELSEIPHFWKGLEKFDCIPGIRLALRLLLATMQRREEVAGMTVGEIDEGQSLWTIPGSRTKNKKPHAVPLSPVALGIIHEAKGLALERINELRRFEGQPPLKALRASDPIFLSRLRKVQAIHPEALTRAMLKDAERIFGRKLSPHDLRRTAYTHMGGERIGASRFIRERIANHSDQGVAAHYDLYEYLAEKRTVLEAWGELIGELVPEAAPADMENVVSLSGGGNG